MSTAVTILWECSPDLFLSLGPGWQEGVFMKRFSKVFVLFVFAALVFAPASHAFERVGVVVETMNSGNYTYLQVETQKEKYWAAVPQMKLSVGDQVDVAPGGVMQNFFSPSLKRTFESIIFTSSVKVVGKSTPEPDSKH